MDIFKAWEEIIGDNPIVDDDDGRQEELAEIAIDMVMEHPSPLSLTESRTSSTTEAARSPILLRLPLAARSLMRRGASIPQ